MTNVQALAAAGLLALAAGAIAQVPPEIAAHVRAAGQVMDRSAGALYAPMFAKEPWADVSVARNIGYGSDALQKLDVFSPSNKPRKLPVLLFVHGGGFTAGDKHGDFYPDNVTLWGARSGMVGVNINYRLAPQAPWPAAALDLAAAIAWTRANIARYGGDPDRIFLWGHSAGANHVADYVGHPEVQGAEVKAVKGAVLLSPFYAPAGAADGAPAHAYYGADRDLQSAAGSNDRLRRSRIPLFLANAEFDPEQFKVYATAMRDDLCTSADRCPTYLYLKDHNHFTEGMAVGTADQSLSGPLLQWIRARR